MTVVSGEFEFLHPEVLNIAWYTVVRALVIASGEKGLDAFLPDPNRNVEFAKISPVADERDPFLPLDSTWSQIDFSLGNVLAPWAVNTHPTTSERRKSLKGTVNVREWTMRAMARYRFVLGALLHDFRDNIARYSSFVFCRGDAVYFPDAS